MTHFIELILSIIAVALGTLAIMFTVEVLSWIVELFATPPSVESNLATREEPDDERLYPYEWDENSWRESDDYGYIISEEETEDGDEPPRRLRSALRVYNPEYYKVQEVHDSISYPESREIVKFNDSYHSVVKGYLNEGDWVADCGEHGLWSTENIFGRFDIATEVRQRYLKSWIQ